ncbi:hypothetical protein RND71_021854 [Anisodus tanguticus]|uniref:Uncharacterized protein n=1 Tax=Anisodus tanguticus TaxID=243964 RepID=A0AAE1RXT4_9SOLA|nr:hypothetical protein RND71_021854 [Anisodus tanguticus]
MRIISFTTLSPKIQIKRLLDMILTQLEIVHENLIVLVIRRGPVRTYTNAKNVGVFRTLIFVYEEAENSGIALISSKAIKRAKEVKLAAILD